ncbi:DNA polymerase epsilon subunit D [Lachnellula suecica]|uniref:DNA polymerase epsilon subunit D n=1 Tax=Lachnellula suecica TaxID=602035 RepID=A0A8T9CRZ2_9HELO|nr:DNA polymerase epsilon subunit D [Lachnellula suecica]
MPPKKVVVPQTATGDEGTPAKDQPVRDGVNIEDLNLPKSIVTRLAKGVLPPNTQIQGNAMLAMTKSATVFVNYLASHANELAQQEGRKTLAVRDVFAALDDLEFPDWKERLQAELDKYTEIQTDKRNNYRKKVADKAGAAEGVQGEEGTDVGEGDSLLDQDGQPAAKKVRLGPEASDGVMRQQEGDQMGENTADEDVEDDDNPPDEAEDDEDDEEEQGEERLEVEEQLDTEQREAEDEALDNGEDSD